MVFLEYVRVLDESTLKIYPCSSSSVSSVIPTYRPWLSHQEPGSNNNKEHNASVILLHRYPDINEITQQGWQLAVSALEKMWNLKQNVVFFNLDTFELPKASATNLCLVSPTPSSSSLAASCSTPSY